MKEFRELRVFLSLGKVYKKRTPFLTSQGLQYRNNWEQLLSELRLWNAACSVGHHPFHLVSASDECFSVEFFLEFLWILSLWGKKTCVWEIEGKVLWQDFHGLNNFQVKSRAEGQFMSIYYVYVLRLV